jgi:hypothetical protein
VGDFQLLAEAEIFVILFGLLAFIGCCVAGLAPGNRLYVLVVVGCAGDAVEGLISSVFAAPS